MNNKHNRGLSDEDFKEAMDRIGKMTHEERCDMIRLEEMHYNGKPKATMWLLFQYDLEQLRKYHEE